MKILKDNKNTKKELYLIHESIQSFQLTASDKDIIHKKLIASLYARICKFIKYWYSRFIFNTSGVIEIIINLS